MQNYFAGAELINAPSKRAAYSDRTAYLMAEMSRLAYFRFEGGYTLAEVLKSIKEALPKEANSSRVEAIVKSSFSPDSASSGRSALAEILDEQGFELIQTYCDNSTDAQGFLCFHKEKNFAVLAFRGTEPNLKDIKTDVKANLIEVPCGSSSVEVHSGYWMQYESLQTEIQASLRDVRLKDAQLFITGHSLGGALAITATRFLANDRTGACYTFGSPPVGTAEFDLDVTTPIYRIINHVDIVPRLPNPTLVFVVRYLAVILGIILDFFGNFSKTIRSSKWFVKASNLLNDAQKYRQSGYGSYLVGEGSKARLRYSVSIFDRMKWWINQWFNLFRREYKLLSDHSIDTYSKKLAAWASYRQKSKL